MDTDRNFMISPISIDFALSMALISTTGGSYAQIKRGLRYPNRFSNRTIETHLRRWVGVISWMKEVELGELIWWSKRESGAVLQK